MKVAVITDLRHRRRDPVYLERAGFVTGETLHVDGGKATGTAVRPDRSD
jgi:hypothetical protein